MEKKFSFRKVTLKKVLNAEDVEVDFEVEVVPFSRRNDQHVQFVFDYLDMLGKRPSPFATESDAARAYVELFMRGTAEDMENPASAKRCVLADLRAARTLLYQPETQKEFSTFFMND